MTDFQLQQQFFNQLKTVLPPHLSMVDELCDLLNLSSDSVYRRIRGEKPISLAEIKTICEKYALSVDQMLELQNDMVLFKAPGLNDNNPDFTLFMKSGLAQVRYYNSFPSKEIRYLCKDMPLWYFFLYPELGAFKTFFWSKTINNHPDLKSKSFSFEEFSFPECFELGQQMLEQYNQIPAIEIWNLESIHSTINQIDYYNQAGLFRSQSECEKVLDSFIATLDHLQLQAEKGFKFMPNATEVTYRAPIQFYVNELILGSNTAYLQLNGKSHALISYSVFNYLLSSDERFTAKVANTCNTLLGRSTLISGTGEKDRNRFFNSLRRKVEMLRIK